MQRDMDLVRAIALASTEIEPDRALSKLPDVDERTFAMHVQWMEEAGLVHAAVSPKDSKRPATFAAIYRLTWAGCEFADSVRSDTLWNKAKNNVLKPGMSFTFEVLKDWLKTEISQGLPTLRALGK